MAAGREGEHPIVRTARLSLRPFDESDVDPIWEIQRDREHMKFTVAVRSRADCAHWLRRHADSRAVNGFAPWTLIHRSEARVIGWGGLGVDPFVPGWGPEVIYFIHASYCGHGLATELVQASLGFAFDEAALEAVAAFARPENQASIRVLEKCGFELVRYEPALERNHYEILRRNRPVTTSTQRHRRA
jgi:RimJ/RimL family protein N-acetyltransferase